MSSAPEPTGPILLGVADVAASEPALQYAGQEAFRTRRSVRIVHVLTQETAPHAELLLQQAAARMQDLTHGDVAVEAVAHQPPLVSALVTLSHDAALVVLQRRHRTRLQWLIEGSLSAHVAGRAFVPTVWVPDDWHHCEAVEPRIVVGIDAADDEETVHLLRHAFDRADELGATLTVVHGWELGSGYDGAIIDREAVDAWADRYQGALRHRLSALRVDHPDVDVGVKIVHSPPAEALVEATKDAALLMLTRGRLAHPLVGNLGSVARAVMRDARCPVEIIPDARG